MNWVNREKYEVAKNYFEELSTTTLTTKTCSIVDTCMWIEHEGHDENK